MNDSSQGFLSPPQTWHRDRYRVALVGAEAARHRDLVARAGYVVAVAEDGQQASGIFNEAQPFDVVVLDFELTGRPPEAVLLFSRRTSPGAPCIGLVRSDQADGFRRAFLAGTRDVLPCPARGEDLLSSIDTVLEPRALGELVESLRGELSSQAPRPAGDGDARRLDRDESAALRQQALDALAERDRAVQARAQAQKKLTSLRRQIKERDQRLALMERACEELTGKLKALRDERRTFEARALEAERRIGVLEAALQAPGSVFFEPRRTDPALASSRLPASPLPSDPDAEARLFELEDDQPRADLVERSGSLARAERARADAALDEPPRVEAEGENTVSVKIGGPPADELEQVFQSYVESERRIAELRAELEGESTDGLEILDAEEVLVVRAEDERRLAELDENLARRAFLERRVKELEGELHELEALRRRVVELEAQAERRARADAEHGEAGGALKRVIELEQLLTERDGRIASLESARTLERRDAKAALESAQSALIAERESHAEARGILDAIRMERDSLRRRVAELEREAAEALTRVEELAPLATELERLRAELRAERSQHHVTRRALSEATGRSPASPPPAVDAEGGARDPALDIHEGVRR